MDNTYLQTAKLLTAVAPHVFFDDTFALKGGTAINLFLRHMPRLSVDLDLLFPDHTANWAAARKRIDTALSGAAQRLTKAGFQVKASGQQGGDSKLLVRRGNIQVKVEVNYVMRGTVRPLVPAELSTVASDALEAELTLPLASPDDIYGGKLVAALDRQHPRDLFDVRQLMQHGGDITPSIRRAFVVYLACHPRPLHEILYPAERDIAAEFTANFQGMTTQPVTLNDLHETRADLLAHLPASLDQDERAFLLSLARAQPEWDRLGIAHLPDLPAIRWKLHNLRTLEATDAKKFRQQEAELQRRFM